MTLLKLVAVMSSSEVAVTGTMSVSVDRTVSVIVIVVREVTVLWLVSVVGGVLGLV